MAQHQAEIDNGELIVLFEDECHLLWGDVCGRAWGKRNQAIAVPIPNAKERQTYYGAVNYMTRQVHLQPFSAGNGANTVTYVNWLRQVYPEARLWIIWDGATYYRYAQMRAYLTELNAGLPEEHWCVTCTLLASNAPQQNPVEDIWLKGKTWLRQCFAHNKTFEQVKACFVEYLQDRVFSSAKFDWYTPNLQII